MSKPERRVTLVDLRSKNGGIIKKGTNCCAMPRGRVFTIGDDMTGVVMTRIQPEWLGPRLRGAR